MATSPYLLPSVLAREFYPEFSFPPHVKAFQRATLELIFGDVNRQIITVPVRHGKSAWHSVIVPAWHILNFPDELVLLAGWGADLTTGFATQVREIVREAGVRMGIQLDPRSQSRSAFRIRGHRGGLDAVGAGGGINGKGFSLVIADDLVKDEAAARSPQERSNLLNWFMGDCLRRLEPNGKVSLIMSRKHPHDIVGSMLNANPELPKSKQWQQVLFPAINDGGKPLWPQRFPLQELMDIKRELELHNKSHQWSSMYMQDPRSDPSACYFGDNDLKDVMCRALPPGIKPLYRVIACDPSLGAKSKSGDYCCIVLATLDTERTLWVEVLFMLPAKLPDVIANLVHFISVLRPDHAVCETHGGQQAIALSVREKLDAKGCRVPLHPFDAGPEKKEGRIILTLSEGLRRGKIRIKDNQGGRVVFGQLQEFPSGEHDDGPDAVAMAVDLLNRL